MQVRTVSPLTLETYLTIHGSACCILEVHHSNLAIVPQTGRLGWYGPSSCLVNSEGLEYDHNSKAWKFDMFLELTPKSILPSRSFH